jgi:methyl-accepting chemotaxis protein
MKVSSIKSKLLILLFISISCSFLILGFYNTQSAYTSQYNLVKQKELDLAMQTSKFIDSYLQSKIAIVNAVADQLPKTDLNINNKNIIEKLELGKKAGQFADLYIGFEENGDFLLSDGTYLNIQKDKFDARSRPWYKKAVEINQAGVTKPYVDITTKKLVVTVFTPFVVDGKLLGVVGSDIFLDTVVETILNVKIEDVGFAYLIDSDGTTLIHQNNKLIDKKHELFTQIKTEKNEDFGEAIDNSGKKLISYSVIPTTNWYLTIELDKETIFVDINNNILKEISLYILLLLIILALLYTALIKILSPLKVLENGLYSFFKYLKGEQKEIKKINITSKDEFGNMAIEIDKQMELVAKHLDEDKQLIEEVKKIVNRVKEGNLDLQIKYKTSNPSLNELKDMLNDMINTIKSNVNEDINVILISLERYSKLNFVDEIPNPSGNVAIGLNNLSNIINQMLLENKTNGLTLDKSSKVLLENVNTLNKSSNETAVSLEETAAALEEITSTVINNTQRISTMASHSKELSSSIEEGQNLASITVDSMDSINEQTKAIADAISVIDQIAFQTNILSLNAAVEAATAGEAGRGFAVVAQEVRNLASRSAEAAREIKDLVENATSKTNSGKKIADDMIKGYIKLKENIAKTTEVIHDISISSNEQKTSIEQINDVVNRLDRQTQNNASIATQTQDIAINTSNIAKKILETVNEKEFRNK